MNAYDPAALCMCGHNQSSHDAVQRAQLTILQVEREQKEQRGRA